ncbi:Tripartite motif-containing protein 9-like protein [Dinothrombium tinctorium]|uniref:Tripartite motif-containing protein 9-like protein n=1 Tax=Dinothrombium tinctorium TaxID=1965070 RepID=A0A443RQL7_9ACAR|nr:Tripartite motif-containing protein 9-like protein [Dinothrombium tinctorium]
MPCYHSLCLSCLLTLQHSSGPSGGHNDEAAGSEIGTCNVSSSSASSELSDADKLSLLSETDSGVICCTSRPNSYVGTPNIQTILFPPLQNGSGKCEIACPVCNKIIYLDENGAQSLPKNKVLQNIVDKYEESRNFATHCQLCEHNPKEAVFMCEQCEIFYCDACRENCHPARGPLAKHTLITPQQGKTLLKCKSSSSDWSLKCAEHSEHTLNHFCLSCKVALCSRCLEDEKHSNQSNHDVQSLGVMCKSQKVSASVMRYFQKQPKIVTLILSAYVRS